MPIPTGFAQVNVQYNQEFLLQPEEVTFGIEAAAYDVALANLILDSWQSNMKPFCFNGDTIGPLTIRTSDNMVFVATTSAEAGTDSGAGASAQVAFLVQKNTARGGRMGRGRFFLPGVVEGRINSAGALSTGTAASLEGGLDTVQSDLGAADVGMFLLHADGSTPDEITGFTAKPQCATQRRRLGR